MYQDFFEMNHEGSLAVKMKFDEYEFFLTDPKIKWNLIKSLEVHINPIKIRLTEELYE